MSAVTGQALGASQIDFRSGGPTINFSSFANYGAIASPFTLAYSGGTAEFSMPSGGFEKRIQWDSWYGCFAPGDAVLWTANNAGPMTIEFSSGLTAFVTQIQSNSYSVGTASICAYDAFDTLPGTFTIASASIHANDNSASLIGLEVNPGDNLTSRIVLDIGEFPYGFPTADFAINRISLNTGLVSTVPTPGALLLVGLGSGVVGGLRRRRAL